MLLSGDASPDGCGRTNPRHSKPLYITEGAAFGRLTALQDVTYSTDDACSRCECGAETTKKAASVKNGVTGSCGCLAIESQATRGGLSRHVLYGTWKSMISRCTNPRDKAYSKWGGRGISVCSRWLDLRLFIEDMGPRRSARVQQV